MYPTPKKPKNNERTIITTRHKREKETNRTSLTKTIPILIKTTTINPRLITRSPPKRPQLHQIQILNPSSLRPTHHRSWPTRHSQTRTNPPPLHQPPSIINQWLTHHCTITHLWWIWLRHPKVTHIPRYFSFQYLHPYSYQSQP